MSPTSSPSCAPVELCSRSNDGIEVSLLWTPGSGRLTVAVVDTKLNSSFRLEPEPSQALEVFQHPYPHATSLGILDVAARVDGPADDEQLAAANRV